MRPSERVDAALKRPLDLIHRDIKFVQVAVLSRISIARSDATEAGSAAGCALRLGGATSDAHKLGRFASADKLVEGHHPPFRERCGRRQASRTPRRGMDALWSARAFFARLCALTSSPMDRCLRSVVPSAVRLQDEQTDLPEPSRRLFSAEKLRAAWSRTNRIGAGLVNLGNTCFANSVLQVPSAMLRGWRLGIWGHVISQGQQACIGHYQ